MWFIIESTNDRFYPDTILASTAFHYSNNPYQTIENLVNLKPNKILVNRTLISKKERILIQRDPGYSNNSAVVTFIQEDKFLDLFKEYNCIYSHDQGHRDGNLFGDYKHMSYVFVKK